MISSRIAQLREQMGLTQVGLSEKLNLNLRTIRKWENGDSSPSATNIILLCEFFLFPQIICLELMIAASFH